MENLKEFWPGWKTIRHIGSGSFGKVYEICKKDGNAENHSALKVISVPKTVDEYRAYVDEGYDEKSITAIFKSQVDEIVSELQIMAMLKGTSHIVSLEDHMIAEHDDKKGWDVLIRMELLTSLLDYYNEKGSMSEKEVIKLGIDICQALELCETRKIIHRDIKPQNIFINDFGDFKLGDFGIARTMEHSTNATKVGTYGYMAPEVYKNAPYGAKADQYSLGMVLYWLMNERRGPFLPHPPVVPSAGQNNNALKLRMGGHALPAPSKASPAFSEVILKACAYDPDNRYESPRDLHKALMTIPEIEDVIEPVPEPKPPTPTPPAPDRNEMKCAECGAPITEKTYKCMKCGTLTGITISKYDRICETCGCVNSAGAGRKYCEFCGAPFYEEPVPEQEEDPHKETIPVPKPKPEPEEETEPKPSKISKGLLIGIIAGAVAVIAAVIVIIAVSAGKGTGSSKTSYSGNNYSTTKSTEAQTTTQPAEEPDIIIEEDEFLYKISADGKTITTSRGTYEIPEKPVTDSPWGDGVLEAAMRAVTGNTSVNFTPESPDVQELTTLNLNYSELSSKYGITDKIVNIDALAPLKNLQTLYLSEQNINDISSLGELTDLKSLSLADNCITDVSALAGLNKLEYLNLSSNLITDISSLSGLTEITEFYCYFNYIKDIDPIGNMPELYDLMIDGNYISDISPLVYCNSLESLYISSNKITDIDIVRRIHALQYLYVGWNDITDISAVKGLDSLVSLDIQYSPVEDISPVLQLEELKTLSISSIGHVDTAVLGQLPNLENLEISDDQIDNYEFLKNCENLQRISIHDIQNPDRIPLASAPSLKRVELYTDEFIDGIISLDCLEGCDLESVRVDYPGYAMGDDPQIDPADIKILGGMKNLTSLNLENIKVVDLSKFSPLKNTKLENLWIYGSVYYDTDEYKTEIINVEGIYDIKTLKNVWLSRVIISDDELDSWKKAMPDCSIVVR